MLTPRAASKAAKKDTLPRKRIGRGLLAAGVISDKVLRPILKKHGLSAQDLLRDWPLIVGPDIAAAASPERLKFARGRKDGGELFIRVGSGALAVRVQHDAARLMECVNRYFGFTAVGKIRIIQAPVPLCAAPKLPPRRALVEDEEKAIRTMTANVDDPKLRAALDGLGRRILEARSSPTATTRSLDVEGGDR